MSYPNPPDQPAGYPPPPPPYGYAPPPGRVRLRGRTPRLLGWIFLAIAIVLFVVGGIVAATKSLGKVDSFQRVSIASGGGSFALDGTGKWVGYYEASDVSSSIDRIPNIQVAVRSPSGSLVNLQPYGNRSDGKIKKLTYDHDGHKGAAAFQFNATETGQYQMRLQAGEQLPAAADIAIGRDIETGTIVAGILIVLGILAIIAAIVLLIIGFVKRSRHKRELQSAYVSGPPPGYAGGPGYQPPPPPGSPPPGSPPPGSPPPGSPTQGGNWS
jgi:flagellar basal body-associated protein FliL